ncbi:MAG TPA: penicillin-binding protein 2 [Bacillota bacterium]|nr:penicillin-binding protein 2 [Bacillota bacterium]
MHTENQQKKKKEKQAQLPFRLNILFFSIFLLFSILILQLGVTQILQGDTFQSEIDHTSRDIVKVPVPRGKMYDRNHNILVDNEPLYAITYTPPKGVQPEDNLELAEDLVHYMELDIYNEEGEVTGITDRDKREYWYLKNKEDAEDLLSQEEREDMSNAEQYQEVLNRIPDEEITDFNEEQLQIIAIKKELDKAYALAPHIIKNKGVTIEEYSKIGENLDKLPGINTATDWDRVYKNKTSFHSYLGSITSHNQGILSDREQYYLTRGYSRNDRVGRSGLEAQYEEVLRGRKEQIEYILDSDNQIVDSNVHVEGERGKDLILTIDTELQKKVDEIVEKELKETIEKSSVPQKYLTDAIAVVMNPKTGEILAVSGVHHDKENNRYEYASLKALHDAFPPGSTIKGATLLAGLHEGVVSPNEVIDDKPIEIKGNPHPKGSITYLGHVNDIDAIHRSSNVYMYHIAMRMSGNPVYRPNQSLRYIPGSFQKMRNYFRQFGLGAETGIDFPNEATGYVGNPEGSVDVAGQFQDFAIGQNETFTALQLAQYVSTIANDGYRVKPHFVKEIRNPSNGSEELGSIYKYKNTEVLNKVVMNDDYIKRVQEGFRRAFQVQRGTAYAYFHDRDYNPAGKTGTAEAEVYEDGVLTKTEHLGLVGYAPFDDPEVAFAVIVPNTIRTSDRHPVSNMIGRGILDAYFELQEERNK